MLYHISVVIDTTKVRLFKQITTSRIPYRRIKSCYWYHKGKTFQANHNHRNYPKFDDMVVIDTTKVRLFKQITTDETVTMYERCCYWYHKGKTFQANHNGENKENQSRKVVIDTTKVRLFKQITTEMQ